MKNAIFATPSTVVGSEDVFHRVLLLGTRSVKYSSNVANKRLAGVIVIHERDRWVHVEKE
jgi:hypothetical protein